MKQLFIAVLIGGIAFVHAGAQTLKQLVIEPDLETKPSNSVFSGSCNSPDLGAIVFKTAISGLWFEMDPPSKLINTRYNRQRNEYVMCVEPTEGTYRFLVSHADYEAVDFFVENVKKSGVQPQFFKINPKEDASVKETGTVTPATKETSTATTATGSSLPADLKIETPNNRRFNLQLKNWELIENGATIMMDLLLTNRGQDITDYDIWGWGGDYSYAYDNLGNKLGITVELGGSSTRPTGSIRKPIPGNTPIAIKVIVNNINPNATHLSQIRIMGQCYPSFNCADANGNFIIRNLPIRNANETSSGQTATTENTSRLPENLKIETPNSRRFKLQLTNWESIENGATFLMDFILTNLGQDINDYGITGSWSDQSSYAYDNLGNKLRINIDISGKSTQATGSVRVSIPGNTPIKVQVGITNINSKATHLTQIRLNGYCWGSSDPACAGTNGDFIIRNMPLR